MAPSAKNQLTPPPTRTFLSAPNAAACSTSAPGPRKNMSCPTLFSMKRNSPKPIAVSCGKADTKPMTPSTDPAAPSSPSAKPRFAYAIATVLGTGYLKPAPGTWGSAVGLLIAVVAHPFTWFYVLNTVLGVGLG